LIGSRLILLSTVVTLTAASGASCPQVLQQYTQPIPRALPPSASLQQVMQVVNDNTKNIVSFQSTRASISTPGFPALNANIAFQRPNLFRLQAGTSFTGPEVDAGSNELLFWFWVRRNQPPAMYFCRHDQFAYSPVRQVLPVEPNWLIEALGVVSFDPNGQNQGPTAVGAGRLQVLSLIPSSTGGFQRITIVDDSRGVVLEEHVYDRQGTRLASATLSRHMRDPATGVTLPRHVEIQWPPAKFELGIDLGDVQINRLDPNSQQLWMMPTYPGYSPVDLAQPNLLPPAGPGMAPPAGTQPPPGSLPPAMIPPAASVPRQIPPGAARY
jgi:hypothetical protein